MTNLDEDADNLNVSVTRPSSIQAKVRARISGRSTIVLAIVIIAISYGLFFYLQGIAEKNFRDSLFEQQQQRQIESTKAVAQHIESDLDAISSKLGLVASSRGIRTGDLSSNEASAVLENVYDDINESRAQIKGLAETDTNSNDSDANAGIIDGLYLVNADGIVTVGVRPQGGMNIEGVDLSTREFVVNTKASMTAQFSKGFIGLDNKSRIAATYPIIDENDGKFLGMVVTTMPTGRFFQYYGNIYDIKSQYMAVLDIDSVQLAHPVPSIVGTPFFGEHTQELTGHNEALNDLIRRVTSGTASHAIYEFVNGERLNTGHPIQFRGQPTYFVFVITPTSAIYATIDQILFAQRLETFTVLAGVTAAIAVLIFLLARWNSGLNREVQERTLEISGSNSRLMRLNAQLEESNRQLAIANEKMIAINRQLERSESVQKEFINVAAHELRTPIQPILGLAEIMQTKTSDPEMLQLINTVERSAKRLLHLSSDILDVAKIEGQTLRLSKQKVELNELLGNVVQEHLTQFQNQNLKLSLEPDAKAHVYADKERIYQVISNLLSNALKFTSEGTTTITVETQHHSNQVIVRVRDTGSGIDAEIFPILFSKFATKSEKGTGLGLFISRNIIEAHGGRMWAENNGNGRGATFSFSLPLGDVEGSKKPVSGAEN